MDQFLNLLVFATDIQYMYKQRPYNVFTLYIVSLCVKINQSITSGTRLIIWRIVHSHTINARRHTRPRQNRSNRSTPVTLASSSGVKATVSAELSWLASLISMTTNENWSTTAAAGPASPPTTARPRLAGRRRRTASRQKGQLVGHGRVPPRAILRHFRLIL